MVFLLVFYIRRNNSYFRLADGECCIATLPGKRVLLKGLAFYPFGRTSFYFLQQHGYGHRACQFAEDVDMIARSADDDAFA